MPKSDDVREGRSATAASQGQPATETAKRRKKPDTQQGTNQLAEPGRIKDVRCTVIRSVYYHEMRAAFMDRVHKVIMFIVILLGSAAAARAFGKIESSDIYTGLMISLLATLDIVFGFSVKAAEHMRLRGRFYAVLSQLERADVDVETINSELALIYAQEPPAMLALETIAQNRAIQTVYGRANYIKVTWFQRRMANLIAYSNSSFPLLEKPSDVGK
ncbi:MAG: hypothetical protein AAF607_03850 [Pseudomonadota bacterium]